jgi:hypothetical protein
LAFNPLILQENAAMLRPFILSAGLALIALPAPADNVLSLSLTPRTTQEAQVLRLGLALYAIDRGLRNGATIDQIGRDNAAGIVQGTGSFGLIRQRGHDHLATLDQPGQTGAYAIFQSGKGTTAHVRDGGTGVLLQYGW